MEGMELDSVIGSNKVDEITRAAFARNLTPQLWETILNQVEIESKEKCIIESVVKLILNGGNSDYLIHGLKIRLIESLNVYDQISNLVNELEMNAVDSTFNQIVIVLCQFKYIQSSNIAIDDHIKIFQQAITLTRIYLTCSTLSLSTSHILEWILYLFSLVKLDTKLLDSNLSNEITNLVKLLLENTARSQLKLDELNGKLIEIQNSIFQSSSNNKLQVINPIIELPTTNLNQMTLLINNLVSKPNSGIGSASNYATQSLYLLLIKDNTQIVDLFFNLFSCSTIKLRSNTATLIDSSFTYSRVPELIRDLVSAHSEEYQFQQGINDALIKFQQTFPKSLKILESLLFSLVRQSLITAEFALTLTTNQDITSASLLNVSHLFSTDSNVDTLKSTVSTLPLHHSTRSIADSTISMISLWCQSLDLLPLSNFCSMILKDKMILDLLFLHFEPIYLLGPIAGVLEEFEMEEGIGESENWGNLMIFVQVVVVRYSLSENLSLHLGSNTFLRKLLPSLSAIYPPSRETEFTSKWILALFGDGIPDESINLKKLIQFSPSIVKSSAIALLVGKIDLVQLNEGMNYFLSSELFGSFLPGIIKFLAREITISQPLKPILIEIFSLFIFSPQLPPLVLEIVYDDLFHLSRKVDGLSVVMSGKLRELIGVKNNTRTSRVKYAALVVRREILQLKV